MNKLQEQLAAFGKKYSPYITTLIQNMRLVLLIMFSVMAGYLVFRVNLLLNQEVQLPTSDTPSATQKSPDASVLSVFDELTVQEVQLDSQFQSDRDNPF